ncbi:MAG: hypothetical protein KME13_04370 [Myxacorys californica WJT36-NPBG1]|nr:hypothetical protein [Myxacorys californica WJT36-NPBG1]
MEIAIGPAKLQKDLLREVCRFAALSAVPSELRLALMAQRHILNHGYPLGVDYAIVLV